MHKCPRCDEALILIGNFYHHRDKNPYKRCPVSSWMKETIEKKEPEPESEPVTSPLTLITASNG
jgi:hypothetical protein